MNQKIRSEYADYIADGIRFAINETGLNWPSDTVIITKPWCKLAEYNDLLGFAIFVTQMESAYDFHLAFKAENEKEYKLLEVFDEYLNLYKMED